MPDMCCALLQWCGRPYGGTFAFESQIHNKIGILLPNKALDYFPINYIIIFPALTMKYAAEENEIKMKYS
jgi:hypothetical protein